MRQDRLAEAAGIGLGPAPDPVAEAHGLRHLALVDVEDLVPVEDAETDRLAREIAQPLQLGLGRAAQIEIVPDPVRPLEQPGAEPVGLVAPVELEKPLVDQSLEDAVQRALRHAGAVEQVREARRRGGRGDEIEKLDAPRQRLHARHRPGGAGFGLLVDFQLCLRARHRSSVQRMIRLPD